MISQKEGQHFGLRDQSKIFLFLPLLTLFVRLVCLPSVLNGNCVHTNHQSRRKKMPQERTYSSIAVLALQYPVTAYLLVFII